MRVKDYDSLKRKVESKQGKYSTLSDITDIVGIRIITYFEDEVDSVAKILQQEFDIDYDNSVDKRNLELDRFGYKSLHYVVRLSDPRNKLLEYKKFNQIKAEIQIRSILQHSWAEIEHDLGYKSKSVIPNIAKRSFSRISALLEIADIEFVNLKNLLATYKEEIKSHIAETPNLVSLDQDTLLEFISSNNLFKSIEEKIKSLSKLPVTGDYGDLSIPINIFRNYGITTIKDLINALTKYSKLLLSYYPTTLEGYSGLGKADAIHHLAEIVLLENNDKSLFEGNYDETYTFREAMEKFNLIKRDI